MGEQSLWLENFIRGRQSLQDCANIALGPELAFLACTRALKAQFDVEKIWGQFLCADVFLVIFFLSRTCRARGLNREE